MGSVNLSLIFFTRNLKEEKRAHTVWDCRANSTCLQPFKGSWVGAPCVRARLRITHSRCKTPKGQRNPGINHNHELLTNPKTENRTSSKPRLGEVAMRRNLMVITPRLLSKVIPLKPTGIHVSCRVYHLKNARHR